MCNDIMTKKLRKKFLLQAADSDIILFAKFYFEKIIMKGDGRLILKINRMKFFHLLLIFHFSNTHNIR